MYDPTSAGWETRVLHGMSTRITIVFLTNWGPGRHSTAAACIRACVAVDNGHGTGVRSRDLEVEWGRTGNGWGRMRDEGMGKDKPKTPPGPPGLLAPGPVVNNNAK